MGIWTTNTLENRCAALFYNHKTSLISPVKCWGFFIYKQLPRTLYRRLWLSTTLWLTLPIKIEMGHASTLAIDNWDWADSASGGIYWFIKKSFKGFRGLTSPYETAQEIKLNLQIRKCWFVLADIRYKKASFFPDLDIYACAVGQSRLSQ